MYQTNNHIMTPFKSQYHYTYTGCSSGNCKVSIQTYFAILYHYGYVIILLVTFTIIAPLWCLSNVLNPMFLNLLMNSLHIHHKYVHSSRSRKTMDLMECLFRYVHFSGEFGTVTYCQLLQDDKRYE